jgi:2-dehydropantoate 2-reductase
VRRTIPNVAEEKLPPFDYIVVTTKNIPDVPPTVVDLIEPAVTEGKTAIVLSQNGLNIEKPIVERFPRNPVISSISLINVAETSHGKILHDDNDVQKIGPFASPGVPADVAEAAAKRYMSLYNARDLVKITYEQDVGYTRWRKLVYNASYNTVCAVLRMDTARMRKSVHVIDDLIRPIMLEILAAAKAVGYEYADDLVDTIIRNDPTDAIIRPSMLQDVEKGNFIELEIIVKEPLLEGESRGVAMPTLRTIYGLLRGIQLQIKESRGMWEPKFEPGNPYA